ncbi:MAG: AAA family ATPase [Rhodospirillales bacterium]|nr:AAA family ATPase [Rhodospirillales bacterium]
MRFTRFEIENFKGIKSAVLDFSKLPTSNIFTLVGLNESGKTTVLEALNSFLPDQEGTDAIYKDIIQLLQFQDLVPKGKKANFTGNIVVRGHLEFDDDDRDRIRDPDAHHASKRVERTRTTEHRQG